MALTEYQQQIVQLSIEGLPPADIADRLKRSRSSVYSTQDRLKKSGHLAKDGHRFVAGPALKDTDLSAGGLVPLSDTDGLGELVRQAHQTLDAIDREIEKRRQEIVLLEAHRKAMQNLAQTSSELFS